MTIYNIIIIATYWPSPAAPLRLPASSRVSTAVASLLAAEIEPRPHTRQCVRSAHEVSAISQLTLQFWLPERRNSVDDICVQVTVYCFLCNTAAHVHTARYVRTYARAPKRSGTEWNGTDNFRFQLGTDTNGTD